jgi:ElaB/YqjD/DUF883 family membrane-anchored ribosome-binding protein
MGESDTFNMSGNFQGAILNIKSTLTSVSQTVAALPHVDQSAKDELQKLIKQLEEALQQIPPGKAQEGEAVAESAKQLVEAATKEKPNRTLVQITAEGLKKAAENIAGVLPTVLPITVQIAETIRRLL